MELLKQFVDLFLHLDDHLAQIIVTYQGWTYAILFVIVFLETGIVFTPFLPGDSLIFMSGAFAGRGQLRLDLLLVLLSIAAILGDTVNYWIGKYFGGFLLARKSRFFKPEHLARTHAFFEKYGGKTIILARFVPIVRTFAPFVAGMGAMTYGKFLWYNIIGGVIWVVLCGGAGYWLGSIPWVQKNFELVVLAIIAVSVLPLAIEFLRHRLARGRGATRVPPEPPRSALPAGDASRGDA